MTMMSTSFTPDARRGQATVETALVLPMLMILLFGIIMGGFVFYAFIQVSNAAREGARAGSVCRLTLNVNPNCGDAVKGAICDTASGTSSLGYLAPSACTSSIYNVAVQSSGSLTDPRPGDQLTVTVAYSYTVPVVSSFLRVFPRPIVVRRTVMMELQ
jgi:Flp pilus assembly protein TadG